MMHQSLVSVVIPAYNAEAFIEEAIQSALAQSYRPIEIIVVDDGSTDSTSRRVQAFGDGVVYVGQPNSGGYPGIVRNAGIGRASGEYILFLDADDVMLPDRIRAQVDFLRSRSDVGCVFADYQNFFDGGDAEELSHFQTCPRLSRLLAGRSYAVIPSAEATALLLEENIGIPSSLALRRNVLGHVPGFPPHLRIGEDFDFVYRIARQFPIGVIRRILVKRRFHNSNVTSDTLRTLHDQVLSFSELLRSEVNAHNAQQLDDRLHGCYIGLARIYANQRRYRRALLHGVRALRRAIPRRLRHLPHAMRSLLRTVAIAAHLKQPRP